MRVDPKTLAIRDLYEIMPGAPPVPQDDGRSLWGEVEGNEHWRFCERLISLFAAAGLHFK